MDMFDASLVPVIEYPLEYVSSPRQKEFWDMMDDMAQVAPAGTVLDTRSKSRGAAYWDNVNLQNQYQMQAQSGAENAPQPAFPLSYRNVAARFQ